jgi:hypothetical protein
MLTYIILSLLMFGFKPEIGIFITNTLNKSWGTNFDGFFIWMFGFILAILLD